MALPGEISAVGNNPGNEGCYHEDCTRRPTHIYCVAADGMGEENEFYCEEHIEALRKEIEATGPLIDTCDWCGAPDVELRPCRDWEEGLNGPVSDVCGSCRASNSARASDAMEDSHEDTDTVLGDYEPWTAADQKEWEENERERQRDEDLQYTAIAYAEGNMLTRAKFDDPIFKDQRPPFTVGGIHPTGGKNDLLTFTGCVGTTKVSAILELKHGSVDIAHTSIGYISDMEVASSIIGQLARLGYPVNHAIYSGANDNELSAVLPND